MTGKANHSVSVLVWMVKPATCKVVAVCSSARRRWWWDFHALSMAVITDWFTRVRLLSAVRINAVRRTADCARS